MHCGPGKNAGTSRILVMLAAALALAASPAAATVWCGENGVVRFSFVEGEELAEVFDAGEPVGGVTRVDVYAWLTEVDPVAENGENFLRVGGFEMELVIEGAEGFILKQEFPAQTLNVGKQTGTIVAGLVPGQRLADGRTQLVQWQVMFQGRPENVRFGLSPQGAPSCGTVAGCPEAAPPMVYVGIEGSGQLGSMFGGGYVPAWLNPTAEPDRTPVHAAQSYADVGIFELR